LFNFKTIIDMKSVFTFSALMIFFIVSLPAKAHIRSPTRSCTTELFVEATSAQTKKKSKSSTQPRGPMPSAEYYEMKREERRNKRIESVGDRERARKAAEKASKSKKR